MESTPGLKNRPAFDMQFFYVSRKICENCPSCLGVPFNPRFALPYPFTMMRHPSITRYFGVTDVMNVSVCSMNIDAFSHREICIVSSSK